MSLTRQLSCPELRVSSCVAGSGAASGGVYGGVAPGAHLIGVGCGETLVVSVALAGFDYILVHQFDYNIRVGAGVKFK